MSSRLGSVLLPCLAAHSLVTGCLLGRSDPDAAPAVWRKVELGDGEACALATNGHIACWTSAPEPYWEPTNPPDGVYQDLAVGAGSACALDEDGAPVCWGPVWSDPTYGAPYYPPGPLHGLSMSEDSGSACALDESGLIVCWTRVFQSPSPAPVDWPWVEVDQWPLGGLMARKPDGTIWRIEGGVA